MGKYWNIKIVGTYKCVGCGLVLYSSEDKYDLGLGWFSFMQVVDFEVIVVEIDYGYGMICSELMCSVCGGYLGYIFDDGFNFIGKRYCINSASLELELLEQGAIWCCCWVICWVVMCFCFGCWSR